MHFHDRCTEPWYLRAGDFSALGGALLDLAYEPVARPALARGAAYPGRPVEGCAAGGDPHGPEAKAAFEARCLAAARDLVLHPDNAGRAVILVGHGATCWSFVHALCPSEPMARYMTDKAQKKAFFQKPPLHGGAHYTCCTELALDEAKARAALAGLADPHRRARQAGGGEAGGAAAGGAAEVSPSAVYNIVGALNSVDHDPSILRRNKDGKLKWPES